MKLTPFTDADIDRLISWVSDEEQLMLWAGLTLRYPLTRDQIEANLASAEADPRRRKVWNAVVDGTVVGHIGLSNIWWEYDRKATVVRVMVDPDVRSKGLGRQMVTCVLAYAFGELDLHRVELGVWEQNERAIRCYESCGFVREGVQREMRKWEDGWWNGVSMGILDREWRERQG
jgi:RimJ/RimL family protein N-acetyltransferase